LGTIGLAQMRKQLGASDHNFPIYVDDKLAKIRFANLGVLKYHRQPDMGVNNKK
jgi:hypothetical protein